MARKNYSKMSTNPSVEPAVETEATTAPEEPIVEPEVVQEPVVGVVSGCGKLNIRKKPSMSGEIVCEVPLKTEFVINIDKSTDEWYSVSNSDGVKGYCMKKFVTLK